VIRLSAEASIGSASAAMTCRDGRRCAASFDPSRRLQKGPKRLPRR
jgi:hypothetical protein